jgi:metallopeptidase MepB
MAKDTATVNAFLQDLRTRLTPGATKDVARLLELKKADYQARNLTFDGNLYYWEQGFYYRMLLEKEYDIDLVKISEYFPVQGTIRSVLGLFEKLFGMKFVELGPEERARLSPSGKAADVAWHEEVVAFSVWDTDTTQTPGGDEGFMGYLYMDLHPRPGKYTHAANFNLRPGYLKKDGKSRYYPATALVCNLSKPSPTKPALLRHDEVETLIHELGHGIHDLSGRTKYARFHGTRTLRDFVEAPSQMLENWVWAAEPLKLLSSHYQTNQSIPDDLIAKLIPTRQVLGSLFAIRQLQLNYFDMAIHQPKSHAEIEAMDLAVVYNTLRTEMSGLKGPEAVGEPM